MRGLLGNESIYLLIEFNCQSFSPLSPHKELLISVGGKEWHSEKKLKNFKPISIWQIKQ